MICVFGVMTVKAKLQYHFRGNHLDLNTNLVHLKMVNCLVYQGRMLYPSIILPIIPHNKLFQIHVQVTDGMTKGVIFHNMSLDGERYE